MLKNNIKISKFIKIKNRKILFTPGPGSLLEENILGLGPFFGRGDNDYKKIEKYVFNFLNVIPQNDQFISLFFFIDLISSIFVYLNISYAYNNFEILRFGEFA